MRKWPGSSAGFCEQVNDAGRILDPAGSGFEIVQWFDLVTRADAGVGQCGDCCVQVIGVKLQPQVGLAVVVDAIQPQRVGGTAPGSVDSRGVVVQAASATG